MLARSICEVAGVDLRGDSNPTGRSIATAGVPGPRGTLLTTALVALSGEPAVADIVAGLADSFTVTPIPATIRIASRAPLR